MKPISRSLAAAASLGVLFGGTVLLRAQPADPGWPRVFTQGTVQLTVYQPQVDSWLGYTNLHVRCAISIKGVTAQEKFGVLEMDAATMTDQGARLVALICTKRDIRFPNSSGTELTALQNAVDLVRPVKEATVVSLDRVLAYLNLAEHSTQRSVNLNLDPPRIFFSRQPAILVMILGEPQFKPVETNGADLLFALNTNWDLFYDTVFKRYYLLNQDNWLTATDVKGPWTAAESLPPSFLALPANENWSQVRQNIPGKLPTVVPVVFVSTQPAELIITQGDPKFAAIPGTQLARVVNTDSVLFFNSGDRAYYFLVAGRWFRAASLGGPWAAASKDMPADFARIPDTDPSAFVKASVPGTHEAQDAVLLASIPQTTTVNATNATVKVVYSGDPQFAPIPGTSIQYAVNTSYSVLLVDGRYYCCDQGIWFVSDSATGPWSFCTSVPPAVYAIPPSSPVHNVTYVTVQSSTPDTVVYSQTAGYDGEYVADTGVLMYGAGVAAGAALASNSPYYYWYYYYPPYPWVYSYGCAATYYYAYGGYYYRAGRYYGPYGGAGYFAAYNPATGTYARAAYAYGPYGSGHVQAAYNPYTGAYARGGQVNTAYGSAGRVAGYNPNTGIYASAGYRTSANGTAAAGKAYNSSTGAGIAAYSTPNSQGGIARTASGDVYAAKDGTIYKRDSNGNWSKYSGSGWQDVSKPQRPAPGGGTRPGPGGTYQPSRTPAGPVQPSGTAWNQNRANLEAQAQARAWGNTQHQNTQAWRNARPGGGGNTRPGARGGGVRK